MATKKYVSFNNLSIFLDNIKTTFATKAEMDEKAPSSHGAHVTFSTTAPTMDGVASVGVSSAVARSDHKHPTDISRASQEDLDIIESLALLNKAAIEANTSALKAMQINIEDLASKIRANEESLTNFVAISSQEVNDLF